MLMRAAVLGYCMGVRRAMDTAEKVLADYPDSDVYTLGPLIHNKTALKTLIARGVRILDDETAFSGQNLPHTDRNTSAHKNKPPVFIIRAHGTTPEVREKLKKTGGIVIDATCPRVLANQKLIRKYAEKKYLTVIAGDKNHGEVTALIGVAQAVGSPYRVIHNAEEAVQLTHSELFLNSASILISQTTIALEEYNEIKDILCAADTDLKPFDTICPATAERQKALRDLCTQADGIVVIGGKESANTKRLFQTASSICAHAVHVESADEISEVFGTLSCVGITAGASTPDEIIEQVETYFTALGFDKGEAP